MAAREHFGVGRALAAVIATWHRPCWLQVIAVFCLSVNMLGLARADDPDFLAPTAEGSGAHADDSTRSDVLAARCIDRAVAAFNQHDLCRALPWLSKAPPSHRGSEAREIDRLRLAATLEQLPRLVELLPHSNGAPIIQFSRDGSHLAAVKAGTEEEGLSVQVWDVKSATAVSSPISVGPHVRAIDIHPNGKQLLVATKDEIIVFDLDAKNERVVLLKLSDITEVQFSSDGEFIVSRESITLADDDPEKSPTSWIETRLWNADSGKPASPPLKSAVIQPDARRAVGLVENCLRIFDPMTNQPLERQVPIVGASMAEAESVDSVCMSFAPDGRSFATKYWNADHQVVQFRKWNTEKLEPAGDPYSFRFPYQDCCFDGRGNLVAIQATSSDSPAQYGEAPKPTLVYVVDITSPQNDPLLLRFDGKVSQVELNNDGTLLAVVADDGHFTNWVHMFAIDKDIRNATLLLKRPGDRHCFSPDGRLSAVANAETGGAIEIWQYDRLLRKPVHAGVMSDDGHTKLYCGDFYAELRDPISDERVDGHEEKMESPEGAFLSPDGKRMLLNTAETIDDRRQFIARVIEPQRNWRETARLAVPDQINSVAWDEEHQRVVIAVGDRCGIGFRVGQALVFDMKTWTQLAETPRYGSPFVFVELAPNRKNFATCVRNGIVEIWGTEDCKRRRDALVHDETEHAVEHASFSPDGRLLATSGHDTTRLWDIETGKQLFEFSGRAAGDRACFSPNGRWLATMSASNIRVWDVTSGQAQSPEIEAPYIGYEQAALGALGFSVDSSLLYVGNQDSEERIWQMPSGEPVSPVFATRARANSDTELLSSIRFVDGKRVVRHIDQPMPGWQWEDLAMYAEAINTDQVDETGNLAADKNTVFERAESIRRLRAKHPREFAR